MIKMECKKCGHVKYGNDQDKENYNQCELCGCEFSNSTKLNWRFPKGNPDSDDVNSGIILALSVLGWIWMGLGIIGSIVLGFEIPKMFYGIGIEEFSFSVFIMGSLVSVLSGGLLLGFSQLLKLAYKCYYQNKCIREMVESEVFKK